MGLNRVSHLVSFRASQGRANDEGATELAAVLCIFAFSTLAKYRVMWRSL
jgi:hypothetical protein